MYYKNGYKQENNENQGAHVMDYTVCEKSCGKKQVSRGEIISRRYCGV